MNFFIIYSMNYQWPKYTQALGYIIYFNLLSFLRLQYFEAINDGLGNGLKIGDCYLEDISSDCFMILKFVPCCNTTNDLNFVGNFTTICQSVPISSDFILILLTIPAERSEFSFCKYLRTSSDPWPSWIPLNPPFRSIFLSSSTFFWWLATS